MSLSLDSERLMMLSVCVCVLIHIQLFRSQWTTLSQDPLPMEFSRQEYWSGLLFLNFSETGFSAGCQNESYTGYN